MKSLPAHLEVEVNDQRFYLVHGFPGTNVHDEVWCRPELDTPNPIPGYQVIIGHTPVLSLIQPEDERIKYAMDLESRGEHLRIFHAEGFIDNDCGGEHSYPIKVLACFCLNSEEVFYV